MTVSNGYLHASQPKKYLAQCLDDRRMAVWWYVYRLLNKTIVIKRRQSAIDSTEHVF